MFIPPENGTSVLREFHIRVPRRYHNIREGGVRMSDKDTATGLRACINNQEFGWRQRANAFSDLFFVCFQA
jgi:hypothetical protein